MGLITNMATKAAVKMAGKMAINKTVSHMENKHSVTRILKKGTMKNKLLIEKKSFIGRKKFLVTTENDKVVYSIQAEEKRIIKLLNLNDKVIGKVVMTKPKGSNGSEFDLYLDDKKIEHIKEKTSLKIKFDIPFNGWNVEGSLMQYDFNVFDNKNKNIIKIHQDFSQDDYLIEYNEKTNEKMGLLILMIIELLYKNK